MRFSKKSIFVFAAVAFAVVLTGFSEVDTFEPVKDNTLYENDTGAFSNGQGSWIFAGKTAQDLIRRALLKFDVSSIPAGSTVNRVEVTLQDTTPSPDGNGTQTVTMHRALNDWGEGASDAGGQEGAGTTSAENDATWIHTFFDDQFWDSAGGDFALAESASTAVTSDSQTWGSSEQLVADVQAWVDDPSSNFGWILIGNESSSSTAKRFDSRSGATPPQLLVEYEPAQQELTNQIFFPQFANGDGFISEITLINPNTTVDATARIAILGRNGQLLPVNLNGNPTSGELTGLQIPANGRLFLETDGQGEVVVGSVTVSSDQPLSGVIVFAAPFGLAGVQATDDFSDGFIGPAEREVPSVRGRDVRSGVAIQNLEEEPKTVVLDLLDSEGNLLATAEVSIPALGQISQFVDEFTWTSEIDFTDFRGSIRVVTEDDLAAVMIQTRPGQFATLPVKELISSTTEP